MIYVPMPAYCWNRKFPAKTHKKTTDPTEWFSTYLGNKFFTLNYDFFIHWGTTSFLSDEFWIKRNVDKKQFEAQYKTYWPCTDVGVLQTALENCEGKDYLMSYGKFAASLGFKARYQIFVDSGKWDAFPAKFVTVDIDDNGDIVKVIKQDLPTIKSEIQRLSGGPVRVSKEYGLKVAATNLECYLTNTDTDEAAWPGDIDLLIFDANENPIAIIEFKKNTIEPGKQYHRSIHNESLYNYYSATGKADDNRKYNRIAMMRDHLDKEIPIINLYYPTWEPKDPKENIIKLEKVGGDVGKLKVENFKTLPVPFNSADKANVVNAVLNML
ncbi:hypothetical protein ACM6Q7_14070 [Peribacillus butanolivorans]|uniref:hypothetical protein n=1 Tax=Peribacillus butanolivorans TaxID=421767 RepID=UPI0039FDDFD8